MVGLLGLDDAQQAAVRIDHQPAVGEGVLGLEAQHNQVGVAARLEHRLDALGVQQRGVGIGHHHVAGEAGQGALGGPHGVSGAQRRVLDRHRVRAEAFGGVAGDLGRVGAGHHHDPFAAQGLGRVDGAVEQGAAADPVQDLGQGGPHSRALARGQDDGGACGHEVPFVESS